MYHCDVVETERVKALPLYLLIVFVPERVNQTADKLGLEDGFVLVLVQDGDQIEEVLIVSVQPAKFHHFDLHRVYHKLLLVITYALQFCVHLFLTLFYRYFGLLISECDYSHLAGDLQCVDLLGAGGFNEDIVKRYHKLG